MKIEPSSLETWSRPESTNCWCHFCLEEVNSLRHVGFHYWTWLWSSLEHVMKKIQNCCLFVPVICPLWDWHSLELQWHKTWKLWHSLAITVCLSSIMTCVETCITCHFCCVFQLVLVGLEHWLPATSWNITSSPPLKPSRGFGSVAQAQSLAHSRSSLSSV